MEHLMCGLVVLLTVSSVVEAGNCKLQRISEYHIKCCDKDYYLSKPAPFVLFNKEQDLRCCGDKMYDNNEVICCNNQRNLRFGLFGSGFGALRDELSERSACCDTTAYNPTIHACCGNVVIDIYKEGCCGDLQVYERHPSICCYNKTQMADGTEECCTPQPYDSATHYCCRGVVIELYNSHQFCCGKKSDPPCCGSFPSESFCCFDQFFNPLMSACCNGKVYSKENYICCPGDYDLDEGNLETHDAGSLKAFHEKIKCCGKKSYNIEKKTCCIGDYELDGNLETHDAGSVEAFYEKIECCGNKSYNIEKKACCKGNLETHDAGSVKAFHEKIKCCGNKNYNIEKKACCKDNLATHDAGKDFRSIRCCGSKIFDQRVGGCCFVNKVRTDQVFNKTIQDCCSNQIINASIHGCCNNEIFNKTSKACCTNKIFDKKTEGCCVKGKITALKNKRCCIKRRKVDCSRFLGGMDLSVTKKTSCCSDRRRLGCCTEVFNKQTEGCCYNMVEFAKFPERCCEENESCLHQVFDTISEYCDRSGQVRTL